MEGWGFLVFENERFWVVEVDDDGCYGFLR